MSSLQTAGTTWFTGARRADKQWRVVADAPVSELPLQGTRP